MVRVEEVRGGRGLRRFLDLARAIHPPSSPWVAPLDFERRRFFDRARNPFFEEAEVALFLARDERGRDLGRVAAIENRRFKEYQGQALGFFGFFECADDAAVARALLDTASGWARARGNERLHGPVSPSTNHECGLLVEGFEDPPLVQMPYNPPYYEGLLLAAGFEGVQDLVATTYDVSEAIPERLERSLELFQKRHGFELRKLDLSDFAGELARFKLVYNEAWSRNYGFVPLSEREIESLARDLRPIIDRELCWFAEVKGETAAAMLCLPDYNQALRPLRGKLFPLGWMRLWRGLSRIDRMRGMALGVRPGFRKMGIDHALLLEALRAAQRKGYRAIDVSWMLAHNVEMLRPLERVGARVYKRYRLYERSTA